MENHTSLNLLLAPPLWFGLGLTGQDRELELYTTFFKKALLPRILAAAHRLAKYRNFLFYYYRARL